MNSFYKSALIVALTTGFAQAFADQNKAISTTNEKNTASKQQNQPTEPTTTLNTLKSEAIETEEEKNETTLAEATALAVGAIALYAAWQAYGASQIDGIQPNWAKNTAVDVAKVVIAVTFMDDFKDILKTIKAKAVKIAKGTAKVAQRAYSEAAC